MTTGYHVTAVRNGSVYGHKTTHCDEAGCAGNEMCLAHNLDGLLDVVEHDSNEDGSGTLDYTALPTFGGEAPARTLGAFSWDESRVLIQNHVGWKIVNRTDWEGR